MTANEEPVAWPRTIPGLIVAALAVYVTLLVLPLLLIGVGVFSYLLYESLKGGWLGGLAALGGGMAGLAVWRGALRPLRALYWRFWPPLPLPGDIWGFGPPPRPPKGSPLAAIRFFAARRARLR